MGPWILILVNGYTPLLLLFCYDVHIWGQWEPIQANFWVLCVMTHHSYFLTQVVAGSSLPCHLHSLISQGASTPFSGECYLDTKIRALGVLTATMMSLCHF